MSEFAIAFHSRGIGIAKLLFKSIIAHGLIFGIVGLAFLTNLIIFRLYPNHVEASFLHVLEGFFWRSLPVAVTMAALVRILELAFYIRPKNPIQMLWQDLKRLAHAPVYLLNGLPIIFAFLLFSKAMIDFKTAIPLVNDFKWDESLAALDRALHFGWDPWRILQPFMGFPIITFLANLAYNFWVFALVGMWIWCAFQRKPNELSSRFIIALLLSWWIGGCLMAVVFSSAGPAFYGKLGLSSPNPYADLMSYLNTANNHLSIWALPTQNLLWDGYLGKVDPIGISAFPSMHNASAILFALMFRKISKAWGYFFVGFAVVVFLSSIHLGWHYAVDGYAGAAIAIICWKIAAPLARFMHRQPEMKHYQEGLAAWST